MKKNIALLSTVIMIVLMSVFSRDIWAFDTDDYDYGDKQGIDYALNGKIPSYEVTSGSSATGLHDYSYGYVFSDVNDYYYYDEVRSEWLGKEPTMDTGVLIGGNAYSRHDNKELDNDINDFNSILPYANIYIIPEKLTTEEGTIEYEFFSDKFNYNNSRDLIPENIIIKGSNKTLTSYKKKYSNYSGNNKNDSQPFDWQGVIYTGGIEKTVYSDDGTINQTVVTGNGKLFSIRYKNAVLDSEGNLFDLLLSFTKISFVSEADVDGPFEIFEENKLCVSPTLYDDKYLIVINDSSNRDHNGNDGIRIGASFEYDYEIVSSENDIPVGLVMFSMNDLDNASMANSLQTDAYWGKNELGNDFKWAEGFGVISGAASYAVTPFYNHDYEDSSGNKIDNHNGDKNLMRISRMNNYVNDGTANGLYFTTSITSTSGSGARNDASTMDTGISMVLRPKGKFISTISAGRRGDVNITLFDSRFSNKIEQSCGLGGVIYSKDYSYKENGNLVDNYSLIKVVGSGAQSTHYIKANRGYSLFQIRIDGSLIKYHELAWESLENGLERAEAEVTDPYNTNNKTTYHIYRDNKGLCWVTFEDIQNNHEIYAQFVKYGVFGILRNVNYNLVVSLFIISGFCLLYLLLLISYLIRKDKLKNIGFIGSIFKKKK